MTRLRKDLSNEKEATLYEMFDYLCSKINFGDSALDSTAIVCMNTLAVKLKTQDDKFEL